MKKYLSIFLIAIIMFGLTACDSNSTSTNDKNNIDIETEKENTENSDDKEEAINEEDEEVSRSTPPTNIAEKEMTLYFANEKYIETGDEDLDKFIPLDVKVEVKNGEIARAVINSLIAGPKEKEGVTTGLPKNLKLIDLNLKDKIILVNLSSEGLNGGSLEEELLIGQIVNSLLELENVEGVKFLVDGEKTDTLMGHFDTTEPFTEKLK